LEAKKSSDSVTPTTSTRTGQLRHLTEEEFSDAVTDDVTLDADCDTNGNHTNKVALMYFSRISKHYLFLVKSSSSPVSPSRHNMLFPVITDIGANYHMLNDRSFLQTLAPATGNVLLGDGKTSLSIKGVGTVYCHIGSQVLMIPNVRYVPDLSESIYSLFLHVKTPNHGLESSYENGLFIKFPQFCTKAIIGDDGIYLDMVPADLSNMNNSSFDTTAKVDTSDFCRHTTQLNSDIQKETIHLNNILKDLRQYYASVKTKRQLGFDVPAGFRQDDDLQRQF